MCACVCACACMFKWQSNAFNQGARQREREEVIEYESNRFSQRWRKSEGRRVEEEGRVACWLNLQQSRRMIIRNNVIYYLIVTVKAVFLTLMVMR